jgi:hypothetical protein
LGANKRFDTRTPAIRRGDIWSHGVSANGGGHDKSFGVMNDEWDKGIRGALDYGLLAVHQIQDIYAAIGVVRNRLGEPVATRFDEFGFVQACTFFMPPFTCGDRLEPIHEIPPHPFGCAIELYISPSVFDVDGTGTAI